MAGDLGVADAAATDAQAPMSPRLSIRESLAAATCALLGSAAQPAQAGAGDPILLRSSQVGDLAPAGLAELPPRQPSPVAVVDEHRVQARAARDRAAHHDDRCLELLPLRELLSHSKLSTIEVGFIKFNT